MTLHPMIGCSVIFVLSIYACRWTQLGSSGILLCLRCTAGRRGRRPLQGQPAEQDERPRHPPHPVVKWKDEDTGEER